MLTWCIIVYECASHPSIQPHTLERTPLGFVWFVGLFVCLVPIQLK